MFRIIKPEKDTYITNKYILNSSSVTSNVGQAGTLDLFKLYNETIIPGFTGSIVELSRILIKFDYSELQSLTSSILNLNHNSFKVLLKMKNVYGGQTLPSNFKISLFPLAKSFDEGRGQDVLAYRDLDTANWLSASSTEAWSGAGCSVSGNLGDSNIDYYVSGNFGSGMQSFEVTQSFGCGDEDLLLDITKFVSASIVGLLPNNGFRISLSNTEENNNRSYFVKRFGSRHTYDRDLRPELLISYDDHIEDDSARLYFNVNNNIFFYNKVGEEYKNFSLNSNPITGSNCVKIKLVASKSVQVQTSSFQQNFNAVITYTTTSIVYYSTSFTGSQYSLNGIFQTGIYFAPVLLNLQTDTNLSSFIGNNTSQSFAIFWESLDGTTTFATGSYVVFKKPMGNDSNVITHNWVVNITNLKNLYHSNETVRLRVFIQDYDIERIYVRLPSNIRSEIVKEMYWRLIDPFKRRVIIPFDTGTRLSRDGQGLYFDIFMKDLDVNRVFEFEFKIIENGKQYFINDTGLRFKVVP